jgi:hypothetical protein
MGVFTFPFRLPLRPVQGVIKLGEVLEEQAQQELHDPVRIRRELEEAQRRYDAGEISAEDFAQIQDQLAGLMVAETAPAPAPRTGKERS